MTNSSTSFLAPIGRVLIASLFLLAGPAKLFAPSATAAYMASGGLPASPALAIAVGVFEILGGLAILLGYWTRWTAFALALFTIAASFLLHNYWAVQFDQQYVQHLLFSKNMAVTGALLFLAAVGAGPWSVDERVIGARPQATGARA